MTEWKLFNGNVAHVSTFEFHEHRERAPHWEQAVHRDRLEAAHAFVVEALHELAVDGLTHASVVDLGCGDGGLIAALRGAEVRAWGYDFQPSNFTGHVERGVAHCCVIMDFVAGWNDVVDADVYVITEVLEHLTDPHGMLRRVRERNAILIASSPYTEHAGSHDECHAWAWDLVGYREMIEAAGFRIRNQVQRGSMFQVVWAVPA